jgi:hypothetical protein
MMRDPTRSGSATLKTVLMKMDPKPSKTGIVNTDLSPSNTGIVKTDRSLLKLAS